MHIIISGKPVPQARPRFRRFGKFVKTYSEQDAEKKEFIRQAKQQALKFFTGPVELSCTFFMPRPKSHYGTGRNSEKLKGSAPSRHVGKPDLSNFVKFVEDCLNGIAWKDDSQVFRYGCVEKKYVGNVVRPYTDIQISAVDF